MYTVDTRIEGIAPGLLMHKFSDAAQVDMQKAVKKSGKQAPNAKDEAEAGAYRLDGPGGELCQPGEHIYQTLCRAASDFAVKGKRGKTYKAAVKGNVVVEPEFIGHGVKDYEIDARPVRIQSSRVMRRRPYLRTWALAFQIRVLDEDALPLEVLQSILVKSGEAVGIGDYRPRFGRFIVTRFERAKV